jgi:hypothetical protein
MTARFLFSRVGDEIPRDWHVARRHAFARDRADCMRDARRARRDGEALRVLMFVAAARDAHRSCMRAVHALSVRP